MPGDPVQCRVVPGAPPEITAELKTAASRRVLPLPQFVVTAVARHIELYGLGPEQTVFFSPRGGLVVTRVVQRDGVEAGSAARRPAARVQLSRAAPHLRLVADSPQSCTPA